MHFLIDHKDERLLSASYFGVSISRIRLQFPQLDDKRKINVKIEGELSPITLEFCEEKQKKRAEKRRRVENESLFIDEIESKILYLMESITLPTNCNSTKKRKKCIKKIKNEKKDRRRGEVNLTPVGS